ncbi:deaminase domain-containing protein [Brevibacillus fluminis]|uniref:deaminase domain-containing protein n=1 Tax=Brevibacillus fluminis TaxID=511487 RepID=UPI003F8B0855
MNVRKHIIVRDKKDNLRERLPVPLSYKGNVGIAYVNISGLPRYFYAHSGYDSGSSGDPVLRRLSHLRTKRKFRTLSLPNKNEPRDQAYDRKVDTEAKILEDIAWRIDYKRLTRGIIVLYTERKPCDSCHSVINQFRARFPRIQISVYYG